jgi:hypothetical protein
MFERGSPGLIEWTKGRRVSMLTLYEELFLLAVDDEKGVVLPSFGKALSTGLAGAVLAELALQNRVRVSEKRRLEVTDSSRFDEKLLDKILEEIASSEKARKISFWVDQLSARPNKLRKRVEESLVAKGLIGEEDGSSDALSPPADPQTVYPSKYEIKSNLRSIILNNGDGDLRSLALLSTARSSRLLSLIFTKDERRFARRCIREKMIRAALGNSVAETIEEIEEAVADVVSDASG